MNIYDYFISNKYTNLYLAIIDKAKSENRFKTHNGTLELHHIIPKSIGGNNDKENLVLLTCKEHFICHILLTKILTGDSHYKMLCAVKRMAGVDRYGVKLTSKVYSSIREEHALKAKAKYKGKPRPEHVRKALIESNIGRELSVETRAKLRNLWLGTKRSAEDCLKISQGQIGKTFTEKRKFNIIKGRCIKFLQHFYLHYDVLNQETFIDAKDKGILNKRTCLSLATIEKYLGGIPTKKDILQFPYAEQQVES